MVSAAGADFVMEVCFFAFAVSLNFELKSCVSQIVEASFYCVVAHLLLLCSYFIL